MINIVMRIFKEKSSFFRGWTQRYRLWASILTVSEGMFCSAAGIWATPLLIIMNWGRKGKSLLLKEGEESLLTDLIIISEGVWGFEKAAAQSSRWWWTGVGISREGDDLWCDEPRAIGIHFLIIPLGESFPLHSSTIKHPPYGTFGKGHYSAPQQTSIRGEPNYLKCADTSLLRAVRGRGNRRDVVEGLAYAKEMLLLFFFLQQMLFSTLFLTNCKLILFDRYLL